MIVADPLAATTLLQQSRRLLSDNEQGTSEYAIDLRRAASSAYYAVYNELSLHAARQIAGCPPGIGEPPAPVVAHLVRWITHGALARACGIVKRLSGGEIRSNWSPTNRSAWHLLHDSEPTLLPHHLLEVVGKIGDLRELRHDADYDRARTIRHDEVTDAVRDAEKVIELVRQHAHTPTYRGFFVLVAMCSRRRPEE